MKNQNKNSEFTDIKSKSCADLLILILKDWRIGSRFLFLILFCFLLLFLLIFFLLRFFRTSTREVDFTSKGTHIVFKNLKEKKHEYFLIVHPQGWQNTHIEIKKGDFLNIMARGNIHISIEELVDRTLERKKIEDRMNIPFEIEDKSRLPERMYTEEDIQRIKYRNNMLRLSWIGPEGDLGTAGIIDRAYKARTENKILPDKPYGALIAAVHSGETPPVRFNNFSNAFFVGNSYSKIWNEGYAGHLWLNVNDVWDDEDTECPNKFYEDNIGFFFVRVSVVSGS